MIRNRIIAIFIVFIVLIVLTFGYFIEERDNKNIRPEIEILYPDNEEIVSKIVTISGTAFDPDGEDELLEVEIKINGKWILAEGNVKWSYEWRTYDIDDGQYTIQVRCWDGFDYSKVEEIKLTLDNPEVVDSDSHKWAVFIIAANFPLDNESKLGNGALNLAEVMVDYFVNELKYSTSNIFILFDDGWIRDDNGFGKPIQTLDQRRHTYDVTYGGATSSTVESTLNFVIQQANNFQDSEIFIWIASHGCGDNELYAGGKIFERSAVFLWDGTINDEQLADLLYPLKSKRTCILIDACFAGGFADKTILNFPELFLFKSNIAKNGRVIISATSKFRVGYTSITTGPLFTQLWFRGILTGEADGFLPGFLKTGRPSMLRIFKDGKVSVEESFYFARYTLKNSKSLQDFNKMEPQINDRYPRLSILFNNRGLILGE